MRGLEILASRTSNSSNSSVYYQNSLQQDFKCAPFSPDEIHPKSKGVSRALILPKKFFKCVTFKNSDARICLRCKGAQYAQDCSGEFLLEALEESLLFFFSPLTHVDTHGSLGVFPRPTVLLGSRFIFSTMWEQLSMTPEC